MEQIFYRGVKIFIPESLADREKDDYIRHAKSSVSRWRRPSFKPKNNRRRRKHV